jgi:hypothetical protein
MSKSFFLLAFWMLALLAPPANAAKAEAKPFLIFAKFLQDTEVELSDGSRWAMDAGDCFPIYMFKEQRTKVILQLGSATFMADAARLKVLDDTDNNAALVSYRKNLENYLRAKADNWKRDAK